LLTETQTINNILEEAFRGTQFGINPFWIATSSYSDAPRKVQGIATEGTKPPIPTSLKSGFLGKKAEDVVEWLRQKPKDDDVDGNFFAILDKTASEGKVVIGRLGGYDLEDMESLEFMRMEAEMAALILRAIQPGRWEEVRDSTGTAEVEY
jgi:hypothetical protein